jgi:hypothetical protein
MSRVNRYYDFYFSRKSAMDEDAIVRRLAPNLRRDVETHLLSRSVVVKTALFANERAYARPQHAIPLPHARPLSLQRRASRGSTRMARHNRTSQGHALAHAVPLCETH